jgi:hypothetical protein
MCSYTKPHVHCSPGSYKLHQSPPPPPPTPDEQVVGAEANALVQSWQVPQLLTLLGLQGTQVMQPHLWSHFKEGVRQWGQGMQWEKSCSQTRLGLPLYDAIVRCCCCCSCWCSTGTLCDCCVHTAGMHMQCYEACSLTG